MTITRIRPIAGKVQGRERIQVIMTVVDQLAVKTATEVLASTSLAVEGFFRDFAPDATQDSGTAPRRVMDINLLPSLGNTTWSLPELAYVWRPSEASTSTNNKAFTTLTEGLDCFLLQRPDKSRDIEYTVGDFYNLFHVLLGTQIPSRSGDGSDAQAEYQIKQSVTLLEPPVLHQALVT